MSTMMMYCYSHD